MKKIGIISGIVILVLLISFRLISNKKTINEHNKPIDRSAIPIPVTVVPATQSIADGIISLPAVVKPVDEANITLNTAGKVKSLNFDLGTTVTKGEIIGSLDNTLKQISLTSAELLEKKAETDYNRFKDLYAGKAASEIDYNNAKYNYENSKNQVELIKQQIADGSIVSPITGTITKKNIKQGEFVNVGMSIASVVDISKLKASVMVSERDVYKLKEGMLAAISSDVFPDNILNGHIRFISDADDGNHNYEVEITIDNNSRLPIKAGTYVTVKFDIKESTPTIQIPKLALVEGTKNPFVYIANGTSTSIRKLILGRDLGDNIEVLNGLKQGENVITGGQINLTEKSIIEVVTAK